MNHHPHLRAYLAGVAFPTLVLPLFLVLFILGRLVYDIGIPIERVAVFPLALLPILWGAWNALYFRAGVGRAMPLGLHGAILFAVFAPFGYMMSHFVLNLTLPFSLFLKLYPVGLIVYYFLWKYLVAFFNRALGLA